MWRIVAFILMFIQLYSNVKAQSLYNTLLLNNMSEDKSFLLKQPNEMLLFATSFVGKFNTRRLFPNGNTDDAYRGNVAAKELLKNYVHCSTYTSALDKWGRIIIAGATAIDSASVQMATMIRLSPSGDVDQFFEPSVMQLKVGDSSRFNAVWLQPDEKIVMFGSVFTAGKWHFFSSRHLYNGVLDTVFGESGFSIDNELPDNNIIVEGVAQSQNKFVVAGSNYTDENCSSILVRYNADGSRDKSFGRDGIASLHVGTGHYYLASKLSVQGDKKIIVTGVCDGKNGGQDFFVARFDSSGNIDTSFADKGVFKKDITYSDRADELVVMTDGRIIVSGAGNSKNETKFCRFILFRLMPDGKLDGEYGYNGVNGNAGLDAYVLRNGYSSLSNNITITSNDSRIVGFNELISPNGTDIVLVFTEFMPDTRIGILDLPHKKTQYSVYPNPLKGSTTFYFEIIDEQKVTISLMDMNGKEIKKITDNSLLEEGEHKVQIDFPSFAPAGNYILRLVSDGGYKISVVLTQK